MDWLNTHVAETKPKRALDVLVIDSHGTVLARTGLQPTDPGENLANSRLVAAMLKNNRGDGRFRIAEDKVRSAFRTVPVSEGAVHVAVSVRR